MESPCRKARYTFADILLRSRLRGMYYGADRRSGQAGGSPSGIFPADGSAIRDTISADLRLPAGGGGRFSACIRNKPWRTKSAHKNAFAYS